MASGIQIEIDKASQRNIERQLEKLKAGTERSMYSAFIKVAMKIKTEAQLRLTGRGHIVTSRLKNSIYIKTKSLQPIPDNTLTYQDNNGQTFNAQLRSVSLSKDDIAVGTNVEYAPKIEHQDSFLYWAMKNVDVTKSVADDMRNDLKFGKFLKDYSNIKP